MEAKIIRLAPSDYVVSQWSGGETTQIAIAPEGAVYGDRDFLWRISSASVDLEESDFTPLPDYYRYIATLRGDMRLTHNGGPELTLAPFQVHGFDGADATHSWGKCRDFNLMLRKGRCAGSVEPLFLTAGASAERNAKGETVVFYCAEGDVSVTCGEQTVTLSAGESAVLTGCGDATIHLASADSAKLMAADIQEP